MAQGADVIIGYSRGSVWNTAVTVNAANRGLLLNGWSMGNGLGPLIYSAALTGSGGRSNAMRGLNKLTSDETGDLRYTGFEHLIAMIMGIAGVPTTVDTTGRQHVFQIANNIDGLFDTVAVRKDTTLPIWEYPSVKWGGFVLTLTADGLATIQVSSVASKCLPLTGQINTTLAAVTHRTKTHNVFGTHIKYRANIASAGALSDADRIYPSQVVLTFNRNLDSTFVMDGTGVQPEPYATDFFTATLSLQFPVWGTGALQVDNRFITNAFAEIPMKMDITMTSPVLAGVTTPFSILIEAPNVVIGDGQVPVNDAGPLPHNVDMAMLDTGTAPAGMVGLTKHFRWTQVSQLATDALLNP